MSIPNLTKNELAILKKTRKFSEEFYQKQQKKGLITIGGHGFDHARRVAGVAGYLASQENKSPFLPILAALLHDLGRASDDPRSHNYLHGQLSKELAHDFIYLLNLTPKDKEIIETSIEDHPKLNDKVRQNYVVKILMDADRLDTLGAVSPVKAAAANWKLPMLNDENPTSTEETNMNSIFLHFGKRIPEWVDMMWTKSGKKIAKQRVNFLKIYNKKFLEEVNFMEGCFKDLNI